MSIWSPLNKHRHDDVHVVALAESPADEVPAGPHEVQDEVAHRVGRGVRPRPDVLVVESSDHRRLKVWFKNENHVTWLNGEPWVCSPDIVSLYEAVDRRAPIGGQRWIVEHVGLLDRDAVARVAAALPSGRGIRDRRTCPGPSGARTRDRRAPIRTPRSTTHRR